MSWIHQFMLFEAFGVWKHNITFPTTKQYIHESKFFLILYRLKMFIPMTILAIFILIPVNVSSGTLFFLRKELVVSDIDKLSISNVRPQSIR